MSPSTPTTPTTLSLFALLRISPYSRHSHNPMYPQRVFFTCQIYPLSPTLVQTHIFAIYAGIPEHFACARVLVDHWAKERFKNVKFWWMLISTPETSIHNMHLFYQLGSAEPRMKIIFEETAIFMLTSLSFQQIICTILY